MLKKAPAEIQLQMNDNINWIKEAKAKQLVVGSQARIFMLIPKEELKLQQHLTMPFNRGQISAPIVLGRDHHDVSGTDSPYRETRIYMMVVNSLQIWQFTM